ncbi:hypothetical protein [Capnocytophaga sp.]|uniref:hypothetical protein n=1 Tax=Capnocytophaga sp. TaxID=44737 RepID=UPI0026DD8F3B|nr:hypothetical protein [Capnocytophaga sp.]MDO5104622.1 hypothetical protein [Capnocytophaga sp.]
MKKIVIILVSLTLTMCASKEDKQRKVVKNYFETILKTNDEDMYKIFSLLKITKPLSQEKKDDYLNFFKSVKKFLAGKEYEILNFQQTAALLAKHDVGTEPMNSDKGTVFYIYVPSEERLFWEAATVVDDQYNIIAIAIELGEKPKQLSIRYL